MGNEDGVAFKSPFCRSFNHYLRNPKINGAAGYCEHFRGPTMSRTCLNRHNVGMLGTTTDTWEIKDDVSYCFIDIQKSHVLSNQYESYIP